MKTLNRPPWHFGRQAFHPNAILDGHLGTDGFTLRVTGEIGVAYVVKTATNLPAASWDKWLTFTNGRVVTTLHDSTSTNAPRRFYQLQE